MSYKSYFAEIDKNDGSIYNLSESYCYVVNSDGISYKNNNIKLKNKLNNVDTFWKKIEKHEFVQINNKIIV